MEYLVLMQLADKKKEIPPDVTKESCAQILEKYKVMMFMTDPYIIYGEAQTVSLTHEYFLAGPKELKEIVWKYIPKEDTEDNWKDNRCHGK